jgi:hypothetical protein
MIVKCTVCQREEYPDHSKALKSGWPVCCGYTMRLESTKEFVAAIEKSGLPQAKLTN